MKNILITGATSGIGETIANYLSKENDVFLSGRRKLDKVNYYSCDLVDMFEVETLYEKAIEYFNSPIDILINCAGQYVYKPIEKMEFDEISYLLDVNFKSAYILSSLVVSGMKKNNWGRIEGGNPCEIFKTFFRGVSKKNGRCVETVETGWQKFPFL